MFDLNQENLDEIFNDEFCGALYYNFDTATKAYQQHKTENRSFFSYDAGNALSSRILTYSIQKNILQNAFTPNSVYFARNGKLNKHGLNGLYIEYRNFILTIGKTMRPLRLLEAAKYKRVLSKYNSGIEPSQLCLKLPEGDRHYDPDYRYAQVTYGYSHERSEPHHMTLIVPSPDYSSHLYHRNLMEYKNLEKGLALYSDKEQEEQVVFLKKDITKFIQTGDGKNA